MTKEDHAMGGTVIREDGKVRVEGIDAMEAMATNEKTPNTTMAGFARNPSRSV